MEDHGLRGRIGYRVNLRARLNGIDLTAGLEKVVLSIFSTDVRLDYAVE